MENVASVIRRHNNKILKPTHPTPDKNCNFRKPDTCPLAIACFRDNLIYKAEIEADNIDSKVYIGLTENSFKSRYDGHTLDCKTALSFARNPKSGDFERVLTRGREMGEGGEEGVARPGEKGNGERGGKKGLNKRSELINKWRHLNKYQACNFKSA